MSNLQNSISELECCDIKVNPKDLFNILFPKCKEVFECIIIDQNDEIFEEKINFPRIISMYGDRTGYEASCNEIRINDYVESTNISNLLQMGKIAMESWENKLKMDYPEHKFSIILSVNDENVTLRFHKRRDNEKPWLKEDLEGYKDEAIILSEI